MIAYHGGPVWLTASIHLRVAKGVTFLDARPQEKEAATPLSPEGYQRSTRFQATRQVKCCVRHPSGYASGDWSFFRKRHLLLLAGDVRGVDRRRDKLRGDASSRTALRQRRSKAESGSSNIDVKDSGAAVAGVDRQVLWEWEERLRCHHPWRAKSCRPRNAGWIKSSFEFVSNLNELPGVLAELEMAAAQPLRDFPVGLYFEQALEALARRIHHYYVCEVGFHDDPPTRSWRGCSQ